MRERATPFHKPLVVSTIKVTLILVPLLLVPQASQFVHFVSNLIPRLIVVLCLT